MLRRTMVPLALAWAAVVTGRADGQAERELEGLRFKFEVECENLHKPVETLRQQYRARLRQLEGEYAAAGDLGKALAAREAAAGEDPDPRSIGVRPGKLADVQRLYLRQKAERVRREQAGLVALHRSYKARLEDLQSKLTRAGKIDLALEVKGEVERVAADTLLLVRQSKVGRVFAITGRFYSYVDDSASFYINGDRVHHHRSWGKSRSRPVELQVGDCVVFSMHNSGGGPKHFRTAFMSEDGGYVVSFRANDLKVIPDGSKQRVLTRGEFDRLEGVAVKREEGPGGGIPFEHRSEFVWEHGDNAILATFITPEMVTATRR